MADVKLETVKLLQPIERGETTIDEITVRKPTAGELRGLNIVDIMRMDVDGMFKLLPRITNPVLSEGELSAMNADDFAELAGTATLFFSQENASKT